MSNVKRAFSRGKAFVPFITAGDPDLDTTYKLVLAMAEEGADLIELGIPFSDPMAEGPEIMGANERARRGGVTTEDVFALVERLRGVTDIPLAFMTYANVVFSRGTEKFISRMEKLKMDALILPDVPYEEKAEFAPVCKKHNIDFISLIAPTSDDRCVTIGREATGFLYCVSSMGVTGERARLGGEVGNLIRRVKAVSDIPCAIGFGISGPEQAAAMAAVSDGVIVGSAIVRLIATYGRDSEPYVRKFVRSIVAAIRP